VNSAKGTQGRLKARLIAALVGVTSAVIGVLLTSVHRLVVATDVDCLRSPCYEWGRPFLGLGIFIGVVGIFAALVIWTSGREPARATRAAPRGTPAWPGALRAALPLEGTESRGHEC